MPFLTEIRRDHPTGFRRCPKYRAGADRPDQPLRRGIRSPELADGTWRTGTGFAATSPILEGRCEAKRPDIAASASGRCDQPRLNQDGRVEPRPDHAKLSWLQSLAHPRENLIGGPCRARSTQYRHTFAAHWGDARPLFVAALPGRRSGPKATGHGQPKYGKRAGGGCSTPISPTSYAPFSTRVVNVGVRDFPPYVARGLLVPRVRPTDLRALHRNRLFTITSSP